MSFALTVLSGSRAGEVIRLEPQTSCLTIGRQQSSDLVVADGRASRLHARISHAAGRWRIEDCGSLNGTYVNSQPIEQSVLEPGDLIRVGRDLVLFMRVNNKPDDARAQTSFIRSTTLFDRSSEELLEAGVSERFRGESLAPCISNPTALYRFASQLHQLTDIEPLVSATAETLMEGIGAEVVKVWLLGGDGRLRRAGGALAFHADEGDSHVLASLTVERNTAMLVRAPQGSGDSSVETVDDASWSEGTALAVPIPSRGGCRGAIECFCSPDRGRFSRSALDFAVAVAHQAGLALENCEDRERLEQANRQLKRQEPGQTKIVGSSVQMARVLEQIGRVGPSTATVLIVGESGTGKELAAHSIHELSRYSKGPFVAVNCAAFCETLLESELFGHEAGAFTGADRRRVGQFERAHRGTIFLDEVGEMSAACQAKVLRVLEGHPFERLGGHQPVRVDVRMVAATHQNLMGLVREKRFREDLYYRLRVVEVELPPLRDRGDDVVELASLYLDRFHQELSRGPSRFSKEAIETLQRYPWPGNIRELKNTIERAVVMGRSEVVTPADLCLPREEAENGAKADACSLREAELRHIESVMRKVGGNKVEASRILGIGRGTLYKKLKG